jgi:hypothetical protein
MVPSIFWHSSILAKSLKLTPTPLVEPFHVSIHSGKTLVSKLLLRRYRVEVKNEVLDAELGF